MKKYSSKQGSKLTKTANGYKFQISQDEWKRIGKEAGWLKSASDLRWKTEHADEFEILKKQELERMKNKARHFKTPPNIARDVLERLMKALETARDPWSINLDRLEEMLSPRAWNPIDGGDPGYPFADMSYLDEWTVESYAQNGSFPWTDYEENNYYPTEGKNTTPPVSSDDAASYGTPLHHQDQMARGKGTHFD